MRSACPRQCFFGTRPSTIHATAINRKRLVTTPRKDSKRIRVRRPTASLAAISGTSAPSYVSNPCDPSDGASPHEKHAECSCNVEMKAVLVESKVKRHKAASAQNDVLGEAVHLSHLLLVRKARMSAAKWRTVARAPFSWESASALAAHMPCFCRTSTQLSPSSRGGNSGRKDAVTLHVSDMRK